MSLHIRNLLAQDQVKSLSLGHEDYRPLKTFLEKQAKDLHVGNITKTYVLVDEESPSRVRAYVSLICSEIKLAVPQRPVDCVHTSRYDTYPAIKIARLAVDKKLQGQGIGMQLVDKAIAITKMYIMPHVGCRYIIVDSKRAAVKFYERLGFMLLSDKNNVDDENPLMLLDVHHINLLEQLALLELEKPESVTI